VYKTKTDIRQFWDNFAPSFANPPEPSQGGNFSGKRRREANGAAYGSTALSLKGVPQNRDFWYQMKITEYCFFSGGFLFLMSL